MSAEHFDVLIVGAGPVRHRRGLSPAAELPGQELRDPRRPRLRSAAPGICSAIPASAPTRDMYTLGYSFRPWTRAKAIADGPSILKYVRETAAEYGIDKHIRFGHMVKRAAWSTPEARWTSRSNARRRGRARPCASPAASCSCAAAITTTQAAIRRNFRARRISPAASCIRSTGRKTSTMPASAWW